VGQQIGCSILIDVPGSFRLHFVFSRTFGFRGESGGMFELIPAADGFQV
jgi:hypothetical protein